MAHSDHQHNGQTACPSCELGPFARNNYFTGKLMVERDFTDEARFHIDKLRHHHQRLHGSGVVCGLKVKQHDNPDCRSKYICIEPGTAIDCCGHEILVKDEECIDITQLEAWKALKKQEENERGPKPHTLQICLRYRECPTEDVPVLFDECGCDDTKCAPNRILESYDVGLVIDPANSTEEDIDCKEIPWRHLKGCPHCDSPDCIVIATLEEYRLGDKMLDMPEPSTPSPTGESYINNRTRHLLPSTQTLFEMIKCLIEHGTGGGVGTKGEKGEKGETGGKGDKGDPGNDGTNGVGLETGLTRISALSWKHTKTASLVPVIMGDSERLGFVIGFSNKVETNTIDADHVFEILLHHLTPDEEKNTGFVCWCAVQGTIVPVTPTVVGGVITQAKKVPSGTIASAVAFVPITPILERLLGSGGNVWVRLRGDFVVDVNGKAIDAEFVRAELPTGNRPDAAGTTPSKAKDLGIQGGLFESWFTLKQG